MGRLNTLGFELNSTTSAMEFGTAGGVIQTGTVRTGTYAGQITSLSSGTAKGFIYQFASSNSNGAFYIRQYMNFATLPSAENRIISLVSGTSTANSSDANITIDNTGALRLYYNNATVNTVIGSPSTALSTGVWYCIEMKFDRSPASGSQSVEARVDQGTPFATASNLTINAGIQSVIVGGNLASEAQTTGNWFIDDMAINDSSGSPLYPGAGQVTVLRPNAAGDNNAFTVQVGGTAGAANNFTRVSEVTPDDVTTYNGDALINQTDDFNIENTPSSIGANDTINVVHLSVRFRAVVAAAEATFVLRIKSASGGSVSEGSVISPTSTTWVSNANAVPRNPTFSSNLDPNGNPWTKASLDTAQIGYRIFSTNTNAANISAIWLTIDSTPASTTKRVKSLLGVGL